MSMWFSGFKKIHVSGGVSKLGTLSRGGQPSDPRQRCEMDFTSLGKPSHSLRTFHRKRARYGATENVSQVVWTPPVVKETPCASVHKPQSARKVTAFQQHATPSSNVYQDGEARALEEYFAMIDERALEIDEPCHKGSAASPLPITPLESSRGRYFKHSVSQHVGMHSREPSTPNAVGQRKTREIVSTSGLERSGTFEPSSGHNKVPPADKTLVKDITASSGNDPRAS